MGGGHSGPRLLARAGLACLALGCGEELEPAVDPIEDPEPRLYLSVGRSGQVVSPTSLDIYDLSDPIAPRSATILEGNANGWVGMVRNTDSPSGRYMFAQRIRSVELFHPWNNELYLLDFEANPLAPPTPLSLQVRGAEAEWSADESMAAIIGYDGGQSLWTMHVDDGDPSPPARIPIELPVSDTQIDDLRWSPGAERLYFFAWWGGETRRLFAARHEDRWPVEVGELVVPTGDEPDELLWIDGRGRALASVSQPCQLASFDLDAGTSSILDLSDDDGYCISWSLVEDDGVPTWLGYTEDSNFFGFRVRWVPLTWGDAGVEIGDPIDVEGSPYCVPEVVDEHIYCTVWSTANERARLVRLRAGETQPETLTTFAPGVDPSGITFNRDRTRLIVFGAATGVMTYALGEDGPGPSVLVSPVLSSSWWSLDHDRFVQNLWTNPDSGIVRVVDLAAQPPTRVDLAAVTPLYVIASPVDPRVFVLDGSRLYISHPDTPDVRAWLTPASGVVDITTVVHEFMVHAPGFGTYD